MTMPEPKRKQTRAELHAENAPPAQWTDAVEHPFDLLNATTARFGSEAANQKERDGNQSGRAHDRNRQRQRGSVAAESA